MFKNRLLATLAFINLWLLIIQTGITVATYKALPEAIPFFYTNPWGVSQLGAKLLVFFLPTASLLIFGINTYLCLKLLQKKEEVTAYCLAILSTFLVGTLAFSTFRIVSATVAGMSNLPWFLHPTVIVTIAVSFLISNLLTFPTLELAQRFGFMDNPKTHKHPAMLLTRSVARGGALPLFLGFLATSLLIFSPDKKISYILLAAAAAVLVGLIDDKYDLNPYIRFGFQVLIALFIAFSGIQVDYINHPSGVGVLPLTQFVVRLTPNFSFQPVAVVLAAFWLLWTMNMISWSNGVDGQFPLIVTVASLVIGVIGLADVNQYKTSVLAFAVAGATLGTLPFSWHPSKLLYGFGATAVGFLLASLSILNGTKVATALLVLLVPTLDAVFTIFRRLSRGRSPFWGDRAHFHHKLLDLGFTQRQIAVFYALAGAILGTISVISSGRGKLLAIITAAGVFIFILTLVNYLPGAAESEKVKREEVNKK